MVNFTTADRLKLELEVKGTARINLLRTPVPTTNASGDNLTTNPDFIIGNMDNATEYSGVNENDWDPLNFTTGWAAYRNNTTLGPPSNNGNNFWELQRSSIGEWFTGDNSPGTDYWSLIVGLGNTNLQPTATEMANNPQLTTDLGMPARPGEEWRGSYTIRGGNWTGSLWAYNGNTRLIQVGSMTFSSQSPYSTGPGEPRATECVVTSLALTPANTTNVRWHFNTPSYVSTEIWKVQTYRSNRTHLGWTGNPRLIAVPATDKWGVGPNVFYGNAISERHPATAGQYAGCSVSHYGSGGITLSMKFWNASNVQVGTTQTITSTGGTNVIRRPVIRAQVPTGATQVSMEVQSGVIEWDAAVLVTGPTLDSVQQLGFRETAGTEAINKLVNNGSTGFINGWTPSSNASLSANNMGVYGASAVNGIQLNFNVQAVDFWNEPRRLAQPISVASNIMIIEPNQFAAGYCQIAGRGHARVRYEWLSATDVSLGFTEWSLGRYSEQVKERYWLEEQFGTYEYAITLYGDIVQAPANAYRVRMHIDWSPASGMPLGPWIPNQRYNYNSTNHSNGTAYTANQDELVDRFRFREAACWVGPTVGAVAGVPVARDAVWMNIFNSSTEFQTDREVMKPGVLNATIKDAVLDPNVNVSTRQIGNKVRIQALQSNGTWKVEFLGTLDDIDVDYQGPGQRPIIKLRAVDNTQRLFAEPATFGGVSTINALNAVMTGSNVPWTLQATDSATQTKTNGLTDLSRGEQVILTRDTVRGYAFIDKAGTLIVRGNNMNLTPTVLFSDTTQLGNATWQTYGITPGAKWTADNVINAIIVKQLSIVDGSNIETEYTSVTDGTSINQWGLRTATATINSGVSAATWATDFLNANKNAGALFTDLNFKVVDQRSYDNALKLELCDVVTIQHTDSQINKTFRVSRLVHKYSPGKWTVNVEFAETSASAELGGEVDSAMKQSVVSGQAASTDTGWQNLTAATGYTASFTGRYRVKDGICYFNVITIPGTGATNTITTFPAGARPAGSYGQFFFVSIYGAVPREIGLNTNGTLVMVGGLGNVAVTGSFPVG